MMIAYSYEVAATVVVILLSVLLFVGLQKKGDYAAKPEVVPSDRTIISEVSACMYSADIAVEGATRLFKCPVGWTVLDVENRIRIEYLIQGGGLKLNGLATFDKDSIAVSGKYEFVGGQPQAQGETVLLYIAVSLIILYHCFF